MIINCKHKFILRKRSDDTATVRMRVTFKSQPPFDFDLNTPPISVENWDRNTCKVKAKTQQAKEINARIALFETHINELIARYELIDKRLPSIKEFKQEFRKLLGQYTEQDESNDFYFVYDLFVKKAGQKSQWSEACYKKFHSLKNILIKYEPLLLLNTLSEDTLQGFVLYLLQHNYRNTTIHKYVNFLRWYLRWANQNGYYKGFLHNTFKPKLKGANFENKEVIYITLNELRLLENFVFPPNKQYLERTRDVFLFCCYTGLRYSDVAKLKHSDIKNDCIKIVTKKTSDNLIIELNEHAFKLIAKYSNSVFPNDNVFPVISNQKMNFFLKEMGRLCGIDEDTRIVYFIGNKRIEKVYKKYQLLTTHCARRTFVVTALQLGISSEVIMRWTGHSDYKTMKPYVKIVDELKRKSMDKFNEI